MGVLEEDRLQVVFIRLEDLEVRPGSQFRQLEFEDGLNRGGGCQTRASFIAAKNIGFGEGHLRVGAGCGSGDDGAGATEMPSAGGTGGGPVVTTDRGLD